MALIPLRKPKNAKTKRILEKKEPQVNEGVKAAMFLRGTTTNTLVTQTLNDLYSLKKPDAVMYHKKNELRPFEDESSLQFFSEKADAPLFIAGYDSKKRPNTLLLGRLFDYQISDMIELHIEDYTSIQSLQNQSESASLGRKPLFLFQGQAFSQEETYIKLKSLIVDFFHGEIIENLYLTSLEHAIVVTALENNRVAFRSYSIVLLKSGSKLPRVELEVMGPCFNWRIGRTKFAGESLLRQAYKKPKELIPKKVKNVKTDVLGDKYGRIHNPRQDLSLLQTRKVKALKKRKMIKGQNHHE